MAKKKATSRRRLFDQDALPGAYPLLDRHVEALKRRGKLKLADPRPFFWYRTAVEYAALAAEKAVILNLSDRKFVAGYRKQLDRVISSIECLNAAAASGERWLNRMRDAPWNSASIAGMSRVTDNASRVVVGHRSIFPAEAAIVDQLKSLRHELQNEAPADIRANVSARSFIFSMHDIWVELTGSGPSASKAGPFVKAVEDAWLAAKLGGSARRLSFGKLIWRISQEENWSLLKDVWRTK